MSDFSTRNIIDFADQDNAVEMRAALYQGIHDRVNAHIETHKKALAQSLIVPEPEAEQEEEITAEEVETEGEQIDELSKGTLGSYVKKASKDATRHAEKETSASKDGDRTTAEKHNNKKFNRLWGVKQAADRLSKD